MKNTFPRPFILLQILNPNGRASPAGEAIHGRVPAEQFIFRQERNVIRCVPRRFHHEIQKAQRLKLLGINRDKPVLVLIFDWRKPMVTVAEQRQHLTEQPCQAGRAAALKGILATS